MANHLRKNKNLLGRVLILSPSKPLTFLGFVQSYWFLNRNHTNAATHTERRHLGTIAKNLESPWLSPLAKRSADHGRHSVETAHGGALA